MVSLNIVNSFPKSPTAKGIVPVATAVVCTTIISWALRGLGSILDMRKPIKADCRDILKFLFSVIALSQYIVDGHADEAGL